MLAESTLDYGSKREKLWSSVRPRCRHLHTSNAASSTSRNWFRHQATMLQKGSGPAPRGATYQYRHSIYVDLERH